MTPNQYAQIEQYSATLLEQGVKLLQTHQVADSDAEQVQALLFALSPAKGATIIDAGSGFGEVARVMHEFRPDLTFSLVNTSAVQLEQSPEGGSFDRVHADFCRSGLPSASSDAVMFHSALSQMEADGALAEALRLVKDGGTLLLNELAVEKTVELPETASVFHSRADWIALLERHGFALDVELTFSEFSLAKFRALFGNDTLFDQLFRDAQPFVARFRKMAFAEHAQKVFDRHERVALHLSGGKDSLATLFRLRPWWGRLTVYWLNTGDPVPEVQAVVERIKAEVPHFVEVAGRVREQIAAYGYPSDLVPTSSTQLGHLIGESSVRLQDRMQCCYHSLMLPMHERMQQDGITLIIRGQKESDTIKGPTRSGSVHAGVEYWFPIDDWGNDQVFAWLDMNAFVPDYYRDITMSHDCLHCTAYWHEDRAAWLKDKHPGAFEVFAQRREWIRLAVQPYIEQFNREIDHV